MRHRARLRSHLLALSLLLLRYSILPVSAIPRPFVLVITQDDLQVADSKSPSDEPDSSSDGDSFEWDEFGDATSKSEEDLDPGSWRPILETDVITNLEYKTEEEALYYSGLSKIVTSVSVGNPRLGEEGASEIAAAANGGDPHARSMLGFLLRMGMGRERNQAKAFLYHNFAAEGGNLQSKMALANTYARQEVIKHQFYLFI